MKNELAIKVYEVDYSFIVKNYLDPQLWNKEWTLFVYKDMIFSIRLYSIHTANKELAFDIILKYSDKNSVERKEETIWYNLGNGTISVLKRQIMGAMDRLIRRVEEDFTRQTEDYEKARELEREHRNNLEEKANDYLDSNGVYIDDVRDAYISYYVNKHDFSYASNVVNAYNHDLLFDVYMIFYKATGQKDKFENLKETYMRKHNNIDSVMNEINEKIEYLNSEEYQQELEDDLESIV